MSWDNSTGKSSYLYIRLFSNLSRAAYFHSQKKKYSEEIVSSLEKIRKERERQTIDKRVLELSKNKEKDNVKIEKIKLIEKQLIILEDEHKRLMKTKRNSEILLNLDQRIKQLKNKIKQLKKEV